jgi:hypothetical protein
LTVSREGQTAAFDATIFLAIMLVASALIVGVSGYLEQEEDTRAFEELQVLTTRLANAVLESTVPNASYMDINGDRYVQVDISVQDMIVEELLLMNAGVPPDNFDGPGGYSDRIGQILSALVDEDRYQCSLFSSYLDHDLHIGSIDKTVETAVHTIEISLPGEAGHIQIKLKLWRI